MSFTTTTNAASRVGLDTNNSSAGNESLFLKVFSGEILTAFETATVMKPLHTVRTISSGKSAQFPITGIASAAYHSAGQDIYANASSQISDIKKTERTIAIDDVLISSTFLAKIDELMNHYDIRSIYASELGKALAKQFDLATMKTLFAAAKTGANISGDTKAGLQLSGTDLNTDSEIISALYDIATGLDENDAPSEGRFAIVAPKTYNTILSSGNNAVSRDFGTGGNMATGVIQSVAGIRLIKSNHLAEISGLGDKTAASGTNDGIHGSASIKNDVGASGDGYQSDFTGLETGTGGDKTYGILAGTSQAIGTVKLLDLATESEYQIQRQGHLFVAKYAMGHGVLRPECAAVYEVD